MSSIEEIQEEIDQTENWFKNAFINNEEYNKRIEKLFSELAEAIELKRVADELASAELAKQAEAEARVISDAPEKTPAKQETGATKSTSSYPAIDAREKIKTLQDDAEAISEATANGKSKTAVNSNKKATPKQIVVGTARLCMIALIGYWAVSSVAAWMHGTNTVIETVRNDATATNGVNIDEKTPSTDNFTLANAEETNDPNKSFSPHTRKWMQDGLMLSGYDIFSDPDDMNCREILFFVSCSPKKNENGNSIRVYMNPARIEVIYRGRSKSDCMRVRGGEWVVTEVGNGCN